MMLKRDLLLAAIITGSVLALPVANINGFCIPRREFIDRDVLLEIARGKAYADAIEHFEIGQIQTPKRPYKKYESRAEFNLTNPDCCQFSTYGAAGMSFSLFDRLRGMGLTFIKATYVDKNWNSGDLTRTVYFAVDNCGEFWDGIDQPL